VKATSGQIVAYDTNTFTEKFRWDIGEYVGTASGYWNPFISSPDGRYVALGTQSGIRLFSVPGTPRQPEIIPTVPYRRGMVFDHTGQHLYIATSIGVVQRFSVPAGELERSYNVGGLSDGIDIAPDDSYLVIAEGSPGIAMGAFQKLDLQTGAVTNITYPLGWYDSSAWDVKIASNGLGFGVTSSVRQIDFNTNLITARADVPQIVRSTSIVANADHNWLAVVKGPWLYNSLSDSFSGGDNGTSDDEASALDRTGTLFANLQFIAPHYQTAIYSTSSLALSRMLPDIDSGCAFDAKQDVFYGTSSATNEIIAYDANSFSELFRIPIGETVTTGARQFDSGSLIASPDGQYLALYTPKAVRLIDVAARTSIPMNVPAIYSVYLSATPPDGGTVTGAGSYPVGSMVTVVASANPEYEFEYWDDYGVNVSTSSSYQFTLKDNRTLVANFGRIVSTPIISPNGGTFRKSATVKLSCSTPNAVIRYTLDGSDPTLFSPVYSTAKKFKGIKITGKGPHILKAKGMEFGIKDSHIATATFTIN
jgi:hypothetical protein